MALSTLLEGNKYSTTELQRRVIDRLVKDSTILENLPFQEIIGNSLTYDTITTRSGAAFYSTGETWVESTPSLTQATVTLKILGGDADVDNFILKTRSNKIDLKGTVLGDKTKAVQEKFLDTFYYGDAVTNAKEFSGLHKLLASTTYNTVNQGSGTTLAVLSIAKLQETIDLVTGWKPTHLVMSKKMRRLINTWLDTIGEKFVTSRDQYGHMIEHFRGLQIVVDDHLLNTEAISGATYSASTGDTGTSIFVLTFDPMACCGVQADNRVQVEPIGNLETKDAQRWRIKWYCGMMFQDLRSCAKIDGIETAGAVTA